jgi:ferredoxin
MDSKQIPLASPVIVDAAALGQLLSSLLRRGYHLLGPTLRDGAIVYDPIESIADLPAGWTADQEAGHYRLRRRDDDALFGFASGPQSWKRYLHPSDVLLSSAQRDDGAFRVLPGDPPPSNPSAFLGVRACDLAAIAIQDRVLLHDKYTDTIYQSRRAGTFIVAVHCTECAPTCFCASMCTGPRASSGYDIALTEIIEPDRHLFLAEAATEIGAEVLSEVEHTKSNAELRRKAQHAVDRAGATQKRSLATDGIRDLLFDNYDHPRWERVAARCMACANCTMACPTCFCVSIEDSSDVANLCADRRRKWDSCFTHAFSYIHGGSVRLTAKSRYRQWLTHKLAAWHDQFASSGCVGCGRCITWCPVGIDITEEAAAIRGLPAPLAAQGETHDGNVPDR